MIAWAKDIGMTQMGTATLAGPMQDGVTTMDAVKSAADEYNKIAAEAAKPVFSSFCTTKLLRCRRWKAMAG